MSRNLPVSFNSAVSISFFIIAVVIAVWLRFYQIELKPLHHDEGVNSYFLLNLSRSLEYKYDPTNYHGPTLYYFGWLAVIIFGESELALRLSPAFFGVITVAMVWLIRHHLGSVGTPVAAAALALSPGLVYFSRDFIHEMSFGCFALGLMIGGWRYAETKRVGWLILFSCCCGLLFATKETAIITAVVMMIAIACATVWDVARKLISEKSFNANAIAAELRRDLKTSLPSVDHALAAIVIFLSINIIFYSSILTNWQGVIDAGRSVWLWTQRSGSEHVKSFWYYFGILIKLELPLLLGSLLTGILLIRKGSRFWLFFAAYTLGITLAYSLIGYKTPWLLLSSLIPMGVISGHAAQRVFDLIKLKPYKICWLLLIAIISLYCFRLTVKVNFVKYDDNSNSSGYFARTGAKYKLKPYLDGQYGYVYAQTDRDLLNLVEAIKKETSARPAPNFTGIYIASPEYWPLPWYLRDYKHVAYTGQLPMLPGESPSIGQPVIVGSVNQKPDLDRMPDAIAAPRPFVLRPGVDLVLYFQNE